MSLTNPKTTLAGYAILAFLIFYEVTGYLKTGSLPLDVGGLIAAVTSIGLIAAKDGKHVWLLALLLFSGCSLGYSPQQLHELSKVKDSEWRCITAQNAVYGSLTIVSGSVDKGIAGSVNITDGCKTTVTTGDGKK